MEGHYLSARPFRHTLADERRAAAAVSLSSRETLAVSTIRNAFLFVAILSISAATDAGTRQLFNGENLSGWKHVGKGRFVVENGLLHPEGGVGLLWFEGEKFANAVLRVVYKVKARSDNSGIFIRIPHPPKDPWKPVHQGLEVQINDAADSGYHSTGSIYTFSEVKSRPAKTGEWNTIEITLDGPRTVVNINGIFVTDDTEGDPVPPKLNDWDPDRGPRPADGYIGIQNHPHGNTVYFKVISVRPLVQH